MEKRKWTNIKAKESVIVEMRRAGKTRIEIANALGLEKKQIKNWVSRYNKAESRLTAGLPPKRCGRPRKSEIDNEEGYRNEIKRLEMENKLLRDFLHFTERM